MLENFKVFQMAAALYKECKELRLPSFLKDQLMRAASSVALNAAEGSGKSSLQDQKKFYSISLGSLREVEAILTLENIDEPHLRDLTRQLGAMLFKLCKPEFKKPRNHTSILNP